MCFKSVCTYDAIWERISPGSCVKRSDGVSPFIDVCPSLVLSEPSTPLVAAIMCGRSPRCLYRELKWDGDANAVLQGADD
jgi:hypothetical protein